MITWSPKVFWCFQGDQKKILRRKGLNSVQNSIASAVCHVNNIFARNMFLFFPLFVKGFVEYLQNHKYLHAKGSGEIYVRTNFQLNTTLLAKLNICLVCKLLKKSYISWTAKDIFQRIITSWQTQILSIAEFSPRKTPKCLWLQNPY